MKKEFQYLPNALINREKWDACVENSASPLIYGKSWYLDVVSPGWGGFVEGDYVSVLPVPWRRKYFVKVVLQPMLCQQLGVFFTKESKNEVRQLMIQKLLKKAVFIAYSFNYSNSEFLKTEFKKKKTQVLELHKDYSKTYNGYNKSGKRSVKNAVKNGIEIKAITSLDFIKNLKLSENKYYTNKYINLTEKIISECPDPGKISFWAASTEAQGDLCGIMVLEEMNQLYFPSGFFTKEGRSTAAQYLLVDEIIKKHSGTQKSIDFFGSNIHGVRQFNMHFGVQERFYYFVSKMNIFPF